MVNSWHGSAVWFLILVVGAMFVLGVTAPLEIASYAAAHQKPHLDESLESSFRISYIGQWSGFGNHWYNYTVTFATPGLVWGDLWITVYFNGTTTEIPTDAAVVLVNHGAVGDFSFATGTWHPGADAPVVEGQTMSLNTAIFGGDGNILFIAAVEGGFFGSLSLTIP